MKRQAKIKKDLSTAQKLIDKKKQELVQLKKEIAYLEMREATGTANKVTLDQLIQRQIDASKNDLGQVMTAGGAIYGE